MFQIDETDFGIDFEKSTFSWRARAGVVTINAEIHGDEKQYERITADEDSPWSWTLYPPHFYLRMYPAEEHGRTSFSAKVTRDDLDEYEVAIYLIEHNDVDQVTIRVEDDVFTANGIVLLSGKPHPFSIRFSKPKAD